MPWFILAALALAVSPGPGPVPGYIPGDGGGLGVCSPSSVRLTGSLRKSLVSHAADALGAFRRARSFVFQR